MQRPWQWHNDKPCATNLLTSTSDLGNLSRLCQLSLSAHWSTFLSSNSCPATDFRQNSFLCMFQIHVMVISEMNCCNVIWMSFMNSAHATAFTSKSSTRSCDGFRKSSWPCRRRLSYQRLFVATWQTNVQMTLLHCHDHWNTDSRRWSFVEWTGFNIRSTHGFHRNSTHPQPFQCNRTWNCWK